MWYGSANDGNEATTAAAGLAAPPPARDGGVATVAKRDVPVARGRFVFEGVVGRSSGPPTPSRSGDVFFYYGANSPSWKTRRVPALGAELGKTLGVSVDPDVGEADSTELGS